MFIVIGETGALAITIVKLSALDLFIKLFPNRRFHQIVYVVMALIASYGIAYTITTLASCVPFAYNWDKTIEGGTCIDTSRYYTAQTIIGVVFDFIVVCLPMRIVWGLQMRLQKKIYLTCIFGMGIW